MIQLNRKKKIIILVIAVLLLLSLFFLLFIKKDQTKIDIKTVDNVQVNTLPARIMTESEKTDKVGIDPSQTAEVVNDSNGLYIYRIKK